MQALSRLFLWKSRRSPPSDHRSAYVYYTVLRSSFDAVFQLTDTGKFDENSRHHPKELGATEAVAVGAFKAHPNGVAGMTVMTSGHENSAILAAGKYVEDEMGGVLVTCGKAEGVVKIWDYTHVDADGTYGRYEKFSSLDHIFLESTQRTR